MKNNDEVCIRIRKECVARIVIKPKKLIGISQYVEKLKIMNLFIWMNMSMDAF